MIKSKSIRCILITLFLIQSVTIFGGLPLCSRDSLVFKESTKAFNIVEFEMSAAQYSKVVSIKGQKLSLKSTTFKLNGETVPINEIHLHGNTTLNFERKSFSIDVAEKIKFCKSGCKALDAFYLISLSMDQNYFHNRLCFDLLGELGLFDLQYKYAEVKINGNSQGIYLMLQRPQDWSKKVANSPFILRRGMHHVIVKENAKKELDKETLKEYRKQFTQIYKVINQFNGETLYTKLNELMHLDDYLKWLALNYVIKNGDYSDELYFYIDPETKRYRIIPWDYDDIFKREPHEGMDEWRNKMESNSLIFSSEDELDVTIAHDPYLYNKYKAHLTEAVEVLSDEKVELIISKIYEDLYPLFASDTILNASSKDGYTTTVERLQKELYVVNQYFSLVRNFKPK